MWSYYNIWHADRVIICNGQFEKSLTKFACDKACPAPCIAKALLKYVSLCSVASLLGFSMF